MNAGITDAASLREWIRLERMGTLNPVRIKILRNWPKHKAELEAKMKDWRDVRQ